MSKPRVAVIVKQEKRGGCRGNCEVLVDSPELEVGDFDTFVILPDHFNFVYNDSLDELCAKLNENNHIDGLYADICVNINGSILTTKIQPSFDVNMLPNYSYSKIPMIIKTHRFAAIRNDGKFISTDLIMNKLLIFHYPHTIFIVE